MYNVAAADALGILRSWRLSNLWLTITTVDQVSKKETNTTKTEVVSIVSIASLNPSHQGCPDTHSIYQCELVHNGASSVGEGIGLLGERTVQRIHHLELLKHRSKSEHTLA